MGHWFFISGEGWKSELPFMLTGCVRGTVNIEGQVMGVWTQEWQDTHTHKQTKKIWQNNESKQMPEGKEAGTSAGISAFIHSPSSVSRADG